MKISVNIDARTLKFGTKHLRTISERCRSLPVSFTYLLTGSKNWKLTSSSSSSRATGLVGIAIALEILTSEANLESAIKTYLRRYALLSWKNISA